MVELIRQKYKKNIKMEAFIADQEIVVPIPDQDVIQHGFFNELVVVNVSASNIEYTPDNDSDRTQIVPAKGSWVQSFKDDNERFSTLKIKELSGNAITSEQVRVTIAKKVMINTEIPGVEYA